jgi:ribonuclease D
MQTITTTPELAALCETLSRSEYVAVDTEFLREQTFWPLLCLIQLAGPEAEAIVDPLAPGIDLAPFYQLMADNSTVKVFHAARQDIEIVFLKSGVVPTPVFDSQVAAMVCGFGDSISYVNLVKKTTGTDLDKSSRFTDWSRRPLSPKQLDYALADVTYLRDVYLRLRQTLEKTERTPWLQEEMAVLTNPATYDTSPENAWQRLRLRVKGRKSLGVLVELAAWRERLAQQLDVPRGRVLRDDALYDIANQMPASAEALGQLRTLSDGFARSQRAKEILEAVNAGLARDPKTLPKVERNETLSAEASATLELLKVLLKAAAAEHGVAPRIIAGSEDLEQLAISDEADILALQGWRRALFGEAALKLKRGELALTLVGGEVRAVPAER